MKFYEWITAHAVFKKFAPKEDWEKFYAKHLAIAEYTGNLPELNQCKAEVNWLKADRPYYSVWPKIIPMLIRLDLNKIMASWLKLPLDELCIRLPERDNPLNFEHRGKKYNVQSMLVSNVEVGGQRGVCMWLDVGERENMLPTVPICNYYSFRCIEGRNLQEEINDLPLRPGVEIGVQIPQQIALDCIRLICTLCFLGNTPQLISPDVLADDFLKFEATGDWKYVEKAKRRHKYGWNVGKHIEVNPHWRRPHFALYWVGKGRTTPVILPRKGALIHKELIDKLPTGKQGSLE